MSNRQEMADDALTRQLEEMRERAEKAERVSEALGLHVGDLYAKTKAELAAAVELHERAGKMVDDALGIERKANVGWRYENVTADITRIRDALAAEQAAHKKTIELVDALVAALPKCEACAKPANPATKSWGRGEPRRCDAHPYTRGRTGITPDYPRAEPLRAYLHHRAECEGKK